jgi:hypothetical protein
MTRGYAMTLESPAPESSERDAFAVDWDRWSRWFEAAVTAATGLTAIVMISLVASALGLT